MRIELPHRHERFGAVRIHELVQVVEIDSGLRPGPDEPETPWIGSGRGFQLVTPFALNEVERRMGVVVPAKDERRKVIDGVLSGIPHDCLVVLVSASEREPIDRFALEHEVVEKLCAITGRRALMVHQADPGLGAALEAAGLQDMVDRGVTRGGKGEGMIVGMLLVAAEDREHVGFVDADNYVPGAVHEYVKAFAAGLHLAPTPYAMVRISWQSKPKVQDGRLVFNRWGRTSEVTNRYLNAVLASYSGFGTEVIATGNAGEHAMTMELARRLRFAGGYAVEPFELIEMFEQYGGELPTAHPEVTRSLVDVFQVETRNPHFHADKGSEHVSGMRTEALEVLAASAICPPALREEILDLIRREGVEPDGTRIYPRLEEVDMEAFVDVLEKKASTFRRVG